MNFTEPRETDSAGRRNKACKACRQSRTKCVAAADNPSCSRCLRLGLTCLVESRKARAPSAHGALASARSRLSALNRALIGEKHGGCAPAAAKSDDTVQLDTKEEEEEDCAMLISWMNHLTVTDPPPPEILDSMLRHAISVARDLDHCGLMGVAMLVAHQFGMPLRTFESVAVACPGSQQATLMLADADVPACFSEHMASPCDMCLLRIFRAGKVVFKPNALWRERVCDEEALNSWKRVPGLMKFVQRGDRVRLIEFASRYHKSSKYGTAHASADFAVRQDVRQESDDENSIVVNLRVRATTRPNPADDIGTFVFVPHRVVVVGASAECKYFCICFRPVNHAVFESRPPPPETDPGGSIIARPSATGGRCAFTHDFRNWGCTPTEVGQVEGCTPVGVPAPKRSRLCQPQFWDRRTAASSHYSSELATLSSSVPTTGVGSIAKSFSHIQKASRAKPSANAIANPWNAVGKEQELPNIEDLHPSPATTSDVGPGSINFIFGNLEEELLGWKGVEDVELLVDELLAEELM